MLFLVVFEPPYPGAANAESNTQLLPNNFGCFFKKLNNSKPGMVTQTCNPTYVRGIGKKTAV
jgi:hypothetical protein